MKASRLLEMAKKVWRPTKWILLFLLVITARKTDPLDYAVSQLLPPEKSFAVRQISMDTLTESCLQNTRSTLLLVQYSGNERETLALISRSQIEDIRPVMLGVIPDVYRSFPNQDILDASLPRQPSVTIQIEPQTTVGINVIHTEPLRAEDLYIWTNIGSKEFREDDLSCWTPNEQREHWSLVFGTLLIVGVVGVTLPKGKLDWPKNEDQAIPKYGEENGGED